MLRRQPSPDCVISNDWVASLVAPYFRHTTWAGQAAPNVAHTLGRTLFIHLVHNLEPGYDGRIVPDAGSLAGGLVGAPGPGGFGAGAAAGAGTGGGVVSPGGGVEIGHAGLSHASQPSVLATLHQLPHRLLHGGGGAEEGSGESGARRSTRAGGGGSGGGSGGDTGIDGASSSGGSCGGCGSCGSVPSSVAGISNGGGSNGGGGNGGMSSGGSGGVLLANDARHAGLHVAPAHYAPLCAAPSPPAASASAEELNLTRAALLCAHSWATVSPSYRLELLSSAYAPLLKRLDGGGYGGGFACDSGIPLARRRRDLEVFGEHSEAKATLQRRYFGEGGVRPSVPLLVFLGRVAYQKGVHLLLECVPPLIQSCRGRVQLLVCGFADPRDAYAQRCAEQMHKLRAAFPHQFWAAPHIYFDQGPLASAGADFGVMPSLYEPSGLVREEFFAAGTPLICSIAGGLRERVAHYDERTRQGSGVRYGAHTHGSLLAALQRAIMLYGQPQHYEVLRANAYAAACDVADTAWHWQCEIQRLLACRLGVVGWNTQQVQQSTHQMHQQQELQERQAPQTKHPKPAAGA